MKLTEKEGRLVREYKLHLQRAKETRYDGDDAEVALPSGIPGKPITARRRAYNKAHWKAMKAAVRKTARA